MSTKTAHRLAVGGAVATAVSFILGFVGVPYMLNSQIKKAAKLEEGTQTWELWQESPDNIDIFLKFTFFNYENPEEIYEGGKPRVREMGPYVYKEKRKKVNIKPGTTNGTIQYRQKMWLTFQPSLSRGTESDVITFVNIPFVGVAKMALQMTDIDFLHGQLDATLAEKGEKLFKQATVRELLFDGFSIQTYLDMLNDPMVESIAEDGIEIPEAFKNGKFALYENKNGSDDGLYEVKTGIHNYLDFGQITKWNSMTHLPWWKTEECNKIHGTDGSIFPPFLTKDTVLWAYNPEVCRPLFIVFQEEVNYKGVPLYRFGAHEKIFQGIDMNPDNECYCTEGVDPDLCKRNGLMMMAGCAMGAPITLSQPHFFGGDPALVADIDGLNPSAEKHKIYLDIEPTTAATLRAAKKLQMNMDIEAHPSMPSFAALGKTRAFPIMWAEESAELPDDFVKLFSQLNMVLGGVETGKWVMVGASGVIMGLGLLMGKLANKGDKVTQIDVKA